MWSESSQKQQVPLENSVRRNQTFYAQAGFPKIGALRPQQRGFGSRHEGYSSPARTSLPFKLACSMRSPLGETSQIVVNTALNGFAQSCWRGTSGDEPMQCITSSIRVRSDNANDFKGFRRNSEVAPLTWICPHGIVRSWLAWAVDRLGTTLRDRAMSVECSIWGR